MSESPFLMFQNPKTDRKSVIVVCHWGFWSIRLRADGDVQKDWKSVDVVVQDLGLLEGKAIDILWTARRRWRPTFESSTKNRCQSLLRIKLPLQPGEVQPKTDSSLFARSRRNDVNILAVERTWLQKMYFARFWMEWSHPMLVWNWRLSWMCQQAGHLEQ